MALSDGIRRNVAKVSQEERDRLRDAFLQLDASKIYPDGVSFWKKQDEIHQATHVHGGPSFLPWHRELCNRFEALLREVDPALSLHYWDWTTDPRNSPDGTGGTTNLFSTGATGFMGSASGLAGPPFQNLDITRDVASGPPSLSNVSRFKSDTDLVSAGDGAPAQNQYTQFRAALEGMHDDIHSQYIGGTIGSGHSAFEDPFVFLLHSNVDRLWASWQLAPGKAWRLDPDQVYGVEGTTSGLRGITTPMEPWAGGSGLRPWAPPENQHEVKNSKHPSVVSPPAYDGYGQPILRIEVDSDRWAAVVQILFGVTNDGGGVVIGPDGKPVPVDPWGPMRSRLSPAVQDVLVGLALTEFTPLISNSEGREQVGKAGTELLSRAVEQLRRSQGL